MNVTSKQSTELYLKSLLQKNAQTECRSYKQTAVVGFVWIERLYIKTIHIWKDALYII